MFILREKLQILSPAERLKPVKLKSLVMLPDRISPGVVPAFSHKIDGRYTRLMKIYPILGQHRISIDETTQPIRKMERLIPFMLMNRSAGYTDKEFSTVDIQDTLVKWQ